MTSSNANLEWERSLIFQLSSKNDNKDVVIIKAIERDGKLVFEYSIDDSNQTNSNEKTNSLSSLFLNFTNDVQAGNIIVEGLVNDYGFDTSDLGYGANVKGANKDTFDLGLSFLTEPSETKGNRFSSSNGTFTLGLPDQPLTIDSISGSRISARTLASGSKLVSEIPFAPDATNDYYEIFEDSSPNSSLIQSPSYFYPLANDFDGDGDDLKIIGLRSVANGSASILSDQKTIEFIPDLNFSGTASFEYLISDSNGGQDFAFAEIDVEAIADIPNLEISLEPVIDNPYQIKLNLQSSVTDLDGSESITRIFFDGLPENVSITPSTETRSKLTTNSEQASYFDLTPNQQSFNAEFTINLPENQASDFTFKTKVESTESSNLSSALSAEIETPISLSFSSQSEDVSFTSVENADLWGGEFRASTGKFGISFIGEEGRKSIDGNTFNNIYSVIPFNGVNGRVDTSFVGIDFGVDGEFDLGTGLVFEFGFDGGNIKSKVEYNYSFDSTYNKSTDSLLISSNKNGLYADFNTSFPFLFFGLDAYYEYLAKLDGFVDAGFLGSDSGNIINRSGDGYEELIPDANISQYLDLSAYSFPQPLTINGIPNPAAGPFFINFDWPDINVSDSKIGNLGNGEIILDPNRQISGSIIDLSVDLDKYLFPPLGLGIEFKKLGVGFEASLIDADASLGWGIGQDFDLTVNEKVDGIITFENNETIEHTIGDDLYLENASQYDSNGDGIINFTYTSSPISTVGNKTDLGPSVGASLDVLKGEVSYLVDSTGFALYSEPFDFQPEVLSVNLFNKEFGLDYKTETIDLFV